MDFTNLLKGRADCSCGRAHNCPVEHIIIEEGALQKLPDLIRKDGYQKIFVVSDCNTERVAGNRVKTLLSEQGMTYGEYIYSERELVPDETAIGKLFVALPSDYDLILAVGGGTINDICRYVSLKMNRAYYIVGTAPSMDGFTSNVAPLIIDHLKTTYEIGCPRAVVADITIMKEAPMSLIAAGVGDILGKYVCLMDWKLSHQITGEYYCEDTMKIVEDALRTVTADVEGIRNRRPEAIEAVMNALVLSGIAMSYVGVSRPASGSEHHLSHYWEMMALIRGTYDAYHGTKVGIATVLTLRMYQMLPAYLENLEVRKDEDEKKTYEQWKMTIREKYGISASGVLELEEKIGKNRSKNIAKRMEQVKKHRQELLALIDHLPAPKQIEEILQALDAPCRPYQIEVDDQTLYDSILYAKELRNRYGLLQLYYDLGKIEEVAQQMCS